MSGREFWMREQAVIEVLCLVAGVAVLVGALVVGVALGVVPTEWAPLWTR